MFMSIKNTQKFTKFQWNVTRITGSMTLAPLAIAVALLALYFFCTFQFQGYQLPDD